VNTTLSAARKIDVVRAPGSETMSTIGPMAVSGMQ
jgi:hypothetical protein